MRARSQTGSQSYDCLTCASGRKFAGPIPGVCFLPNATCTNSSVCSSCNASATYYCLQCVSQINVAYNGACILNYPSFWNKLSLGTTGLTLYYGYELAYTNVSADPTYLYFNIKGYNPGWIGLGFGTSHGSVASKGMRASMTIERGVISAPPLPGA